MSVVLLGGVVGGSRVRLAEGGHPEPGRARGLVGLSLYGSRKMWAHLNREGIEVARCTVERLMRTHGWQGVTRRSEPSTTVADPDAARAEDLVQRDFHGSGPDLLWVADFTYTTRIGGRWGYTAFAIDAFAGTIVGWQVAQHATGQLAQATFTGGVELPARQGHRVAPGAWRGSRNHG